MDWSPVVVDITGAVVISPVELVVVDSTTVVSWGSDVKSVMPVLGISGSVLVIGKASSSETVEYQFSINHFKALTI